MTKRNLIAKRQREQVEVIIAHLIDLLDTLDGDADAEPSLGSTHTHPSLMALNAWTPLKHQSPDTAGQLRDFSGSQLDWGSRAAGNTIDGEIDAGDEPESDPAENGIADMDGYQEQYGGRPFCKGVL